MPSPEWEQARGAELRAETPQMGYSLQRLLLEIGEFDEQSLAQLRGVADITFPVAFVIAVVQWEIPARSALIAYLWTWLENQVMAALKSVPWARPTASACCFRSLRCCPASPMQPARSATTIYAISRPASPSCAAGMKLNIAGCSVPDGNASHE